jgi:hypothetical protein
VTGSAPGQVALQRCSQRFVANHLIKHSNVRAKQEHRLQYAELVLSQIAAWNSWTPRAPGSVRALDPEYLRHQAARAYRIRWEIGPPQRA